MKKILVLIGLAILISGSLTLVQYQERFALAKEAAAKGPAVSTPAPAVHAAAETYDIPAESGHDEGAWDGECR
jgi:hypothetical protein